MPRNSASCHKRGGIEPLRVSTPHELKSCLSTSPTHPSPPANIWPASVCAQAWPLVGSLPCTRSKAHMLGWGGGLARQDPTGMLLCQFAQGKRLRRGGSVAAAAQGIEPRTSRTRSENHATRPSCHLILASPHMSIDMAMTYSSSPAAGPLWTDDSYGPAVDYPKQAPATVVVDRRGIRPAAAGEEESNPCGSPRPTS